MVLIDYIIINNCRLCHKNPGEVDLTTNKDINNKISQFTKITVSDNVAHLLPRSICKECKSILDNFQKFFKRTTKVDKSLRKIVTNRFLNTNDFDRKCIWCPAILTNAEQHKKHMQTHIDSDFKNDEVHNENGANRKFSSPEIDNKEIIENHCQEHDDNIGNKRNFRKHVEICDNSKLICDRENCGTICSSAYSLKIHQLKHEGRRPFLCVTCGKSFLTKNSLLCHEKIHSDVKAYNCKLCNIGFSVRSNLRAHEKKHHEGIRFYCSQCTRAFTSKYSLNRHEKIHVGVKEYQCETCPSAFYTNKELLKHQIYHKGLRQHKCAECYKTFYERHHLIIHLRSHTGERPYVCKMPNCGKSFTESQKLKRHHNSRHAQS